MVNLPLPPWRQTLPPQVEIRESDIHGLGVFAVQDLGMLQVVGGTHRVQPDSSKLWYPPLSQIRPVRDLPIQRSNLGAKLNHSDTPNGAYIESAGFWWLYTTRPVPAGGELTVSYHMFADPPCV